MAPTPAAPEKTRRQPEKVHALPSGFYDAFVLYGIRVHTVEPGRLLCHFTVPSPASSTGATSCTAARLSRCLTWRALLSSTLLRHKPGGSPLTTRDNNSYINYNSICCHLQEEIDMKAKVMRAGKAVGVATVELKKKSGKIIAQARYSKYLGASSRL